MAQFFQLPEGSSPKFRQALECLIQAHVEELAKVKNEELVKAQAPNISTLALAKAARDQSAQPVSLGAKVTSPVATPNADAGNDASEANDKNALNKCMGYVGSKFGISIDAHGHSNQVSMFGNVKDALSDGHDIDEYEYDVSMHYHTTGCAQATARSDWFSHLSLAFICANAVYLGVDSDMNLAASLNEAEPVFILCENIFCVFFTLEVLVRFMAFKQKKDCLLDMWFKFDSILVCIMVLETWVIFLITHFTGASSALPTGPMKLLRLLRLARVVRIMRAFPELMTMVKGMIAATKPVSSSMAMLIGIIYVFAITLHMLVKEDEEVFEYFGTVTRCMMTLTANGTLGDSIGTVMRGIARNVPALCVFFVFVILSAVTVTNMLIGVLCEVVSHVAEAEKEYAVLAKLKATLLVMLKELDQDGSGDISREELHSVINHPDALEVLDELDINVTYFVDMIEMLYESAESRSVPEIMQLLLDNQGARSPDLKDIVQLHNFTRWSIRQEMQGLRYMVASVSQQSCSRSAFQL